MINHNFPLKNHKILKLAIFFFLAFSLLSFSYSEVTITKIYDLNRKITINPNVLERDLVIHDRLPKLTYNDFKDIKGINKKNTDLVGKVYYSYVYLNTNDITLEAIEDTELIVNLENYVSNRKDLDYLFLIDLGNNINDGICEINNKILKCNFNHNYYGEQNLRITFKKPFWEEDYLDVKILIENVYDEPILDESKLNENGRVEKDLLVDETQTYDLRDYVIEIDTPNSNPKSNPESSSSSAYICSYSGYKITCTFYGVDTYNLEFSYPGTSLKVPFTFNVNSRNQAPKYIGNLGLGETHFTNMFRKDFNMLELFKDDNLELNYSYEFSGNGNVNCNLENNIYTCNFEGNGYIDIKFKASDNEFEVSSSDYRIALLNQNDIEFIYDFDTNFKVVDTLAFDLPLKLKSNFDFDIYDLNISINNGLGNTESYKFDLLANETKEFVFHDLTTNNPTLYDIVPIINSKALTDYLIPVLSIPNTPESLKEYLSVESHTPGDFINYGVYGHHKVLPGFIFGVPYTITNSLNMPIELYVCQAIPKYSLEQKYYLFKKENNNYNLIPENYFCEEKLLDNITNMTTYIQNLDNYAIVQSVVISKTPITPTSSTSWDFFEYIKNNPEVLLYTNDVLSAYDFTKYIYSFIPEQSYGNSLNKNTDYNVVVGFTNGYAYEIVNVPIGIQAGRSEVIGEYFDETDYYKITSDIKYVDLNYNKGTFGSNINSSKSETFSFKTKDLSYDGSGPPWYKIVSGTFLDNSFDMKGYKKFIIN